MAISNRGATSIPKFAPYMGIAGALILFVSWSVSTGVADRLSARRTAIGNAQADRTLAQRLSDLALQQSNLDKGVIRVEYSGGAIRALAKRPELSRLVSATQDHQFFQSGLHDYSRSFDLAARVEASANQLQATDSIRSAIVAIRDSINQAYKIIDSARKVYDRAMRGGIAMDTLSAETADSIASRMQSAHSIWRSIPDNRFVSLNNRLYGLDEVMFQRAEAQVRSLTRWNSVARVAAWTLYVAGSLLVIYGKLLEVRSKGVSTDGRKTDSTSTPHPDGVER